MVLHMDNIYCGDGDHQRGEKGDLSSDLLVRSTNACRHASLRVRSIELHLWEWINCINVYKFIMAITSSD
jgi:hypothetical protein